MSVSCHRKSAVVSAGFATRVPELSRSEQVPSPVQDVNTCCIYRPYTAIMPMNSRRLYLQLV